MINKQGVYWTKEKIMMGCDGTENHLAVYLH